jgi:ABC-type lipopolysaccharide export system ATPase subunit
MYYYLVKSFTTIPRSHLNTIGVLKLTGVAMRGGERRRVEMSRVDALQLVYINLIVSNAIDCL